MVIISIDVGMKHLAYCVLEQEEDHCRILDWDVIDLCSTGISNICIGRLKNNKPCTRIAKYFKHNKYYCKSHAKKEKFSIPTKEMNIKRIKKLKILDLKSMAKKLDYKLPPKPKKIDYIEEFMKDLSTNYFATVNRVDSRSINLVTYGKRIKESFNKISANFTIDCVLIENQIGPLALRMKMLQGMIMQHFIEVNCINIKEISPSNKLKEFIGNKKTTYNERKKKSIQIMRELLQTNNQLNNNTWLDHFNSHKKKDDLADSFLQARWFIKNK